MLQSFCQLWSVRVNCSCFVFTPHIRILSEIESITHTERERDTHTRVHCTVHVYDNYNTVFRLWILKFTSFRMYCNWCYANTKFFPSTHFAAMLYCLLFYWKTVFNSLWLVFVIKSTQKANICVCECECVHVCLYTAFSLHFCSSLIE